MYTLSVQKAISAAHQLRNYDGPCANVHGHNWKVRVEVESNKVDEIGIAIDFSTLDKKLWQVISTFDHKLINSVPPFDKINPTAENMVKYIFDQLKLQLRENVHLKKVTVWETDEYIVSYEE
jgi:6-pyruvoyltetrahydropterin/6-carboxytetrahydropterin synthase